ncbi:MAG: hypothetical protein Q9M22_03315 [Mariprofundaceae bacterium]|nr:hypothetical protein [Mariprofundaceae bacterium]
MLEEKIKQANEASNKQWKYRLLMLTAGLLVGVTITVLVVWYGSVLSLSGLQPVAQKENLTVVRGDPLGKNPPEINPSKLRQSFIDRLQNYENNLETTLSKANLDAWNPAAKARIKSLKAAAIAAFTKADYSTAIDQMGQLEATGREIISLWNTSFSDVMAAGQKALDKDDAVRGKLYSAKALMIKPNNQQAQALAHKFDVLPALLALIKKADIARIENRAKKERHWLDQALKLAPEREALKQRRDVLAKSIKEKRVSALLAHALLAVKKNDFNAASRYYNKAKAIDPNRMGLRAVGEKIAKASDALRLKQVKAEARQSISMDHWREAKKIYKKATQHYPQDREIRDGLALANKLLALQTRIAKHLQQSTRLASENVFAQAQVALIQAGALSSNSPALAKKALKLKELLRKVKIKIPVLVTSDNQTYILVKGVGKVGFTAAHTIQLKPGDYTFEGSRTGYKSTWVQVHIPIGGKSVDVEVICDERI